MPTIPFETSCVCTSGQLAGDARRKFWRRHAGVLLGKGSGQPVCLQGSAMNADIIAFIARQVRDGGGHVHRYPVKA